MHSMKMTTTRLKYPRYVSRITDAINKLTERCTANAHHIHQYDYNKPEAHLEYDCMLIVSSVSNLSVSILPKIGNCTFVTKYLYIMRESNRVIRYKSNVTHLMMIHDKLDKDYALMC